MTSSRRVECQSTNIVDNTKGFVEIDIRRSTNRGRKQLQLQLRKLKKQNWLRSWLRLPVQGGMYNSLYASFVVTQGFLPNGLNKPLNS